MTALALRVASKCLALTAQPPALDDAPRFGVSPGASPDDGVEEVASP